MRLITLMVWTPPLVVTQHHHLGTSMPSGGRSLIAAQPSRPECCPARVTVLSAVSRAAATSGPVRKRGHCKGHRSLIAGWAVKPSVHRLSGDECPCRVMVLSAVGVSRRMMVSEAPAS